jgi:hypothetical protein
MRKMDKSIKTIGDLAKKGKEVILNLREQDIADYRPAGDMYIEDIVKIGEYEGTQYPTIPGGIRFWLNNGDSLIYVKAK